MRGENENVGEENENVGGEKEWGGFKVSKKWEGKNKNDKIKRAVREEGYRGNRDGGEGRSRR